MCGKHISSHPGPKARAATQVYHPPKSCGQRCGRKLGGWKSRFTVQDLLADVRCSRAVLDLLSATDVGRLVPVPAKEEAGSEWERRERREREEKRRVEAEELGRGRGTTIVSPVSKVRYFRFKSVSKLGHAPLHGICRRGVGRIMVPFVLSPAFSFVISLDRLGRRGKGSLQRAAVPHHDIQAACE